VDIVPLGGKIASSGIFIRQRPDGKITGYYAVIQTNNASQRYQSAINERIKFTF